MNISLPFYIELHIILGKAFIGVTKLLEMSCSIKSIGMTNQFFRFEQHYPQIPWINLYKRVVRESATT